MTAASGPGPVRPAAPTARRATRRTAGPALPEQVVPDGVPG
ncbi:hypothetical protein ACNAW0_00085 [Micromonospora sp. SL1-18]